MATTPIAPLTQLITKGLNPVNGNANGTAGSVCLDAPDDGRAVSEEEYWAIWYEHPDASYEWNDGYLEAKPLSNQIQFRLYKWFLILLEHYLQAYQTGQMMGLETGFSMTVPSLRLPGQSKKKRCASQTLLLFATITPRFGGRQSAPTAGSATYVLSLYLIQPRGK